MRIPSGAQVPRIYHAAPLQCGEHYCLDDRASNHAIRVLRLRTGERLTLFNGQGGEYLATLIKTERRTACVFIDEFRETETESPLDITLAQGISRGERMDYTLQKAVELGVSGIIPLKTEHCGVSISGQRLEKRLQHWRGVMIHACEQSGRNRIPAINAAMNLQDWIGQCQEEWAASDRQPDHTTRIILDPGSNKALTDLPAPNGTLTLIIGPEGGLSEAENRQLEKIGFLRIRLGPRILRTETAGIAALAALQVLWGDFRSTS